MRRKEYRDASERKQDRWIGFVAFPLINVGLLIVEFVLFVASYQIGIGWSSQAMGLLRSLPWIVNGLVLIWSLIFRPEFTVGYLAFMAFIIVVAVVVGVLFLAGCFILIGVAVVLSAANSGGGCPSVFVALIIPLLGIFLKGKHIGIWCTSHQNKGFI